LPIEEQKIGNIRQAPVMPMPMPNADRRLSTIEEIAAENSEERMKFALLIGKNPANANNINVREGGNNHLCSICNVELPVSLPEVRNIIDFLEKRAHYLM